MNKSELIKKVSQLAGIKQADAEKAVSATFEAIKSGLNKDSETKILGFGKFEAILRPEREGRNPATGEAIHIPEKTVVKFKPYF